MVKGQARCFLFPPASTRTAPIAALAGLLWKNITESVQRILLFSLFLDTFRIQGILPRFFCSSTLSIFKGFFCFYTLGLLYFWTFNQNPTILMYPLRLSFFCNKRFPPFGLLLDQVPSELSAADGKRGARLYKSTTTATMAGLSKSKMSFGGQTDIELSQPPGQLKIIFSW